MTQAGTNCSEQNMVLLSAFLGIILISSCLGSDALAGGIEEKKHDDLDVLDALDFAMNEFNAMQNNMHRLMPTKVSDAKVHVRIQFYLFIYLFLCLFIYYNLLHTITEAKGCNAKESKTPYCRRTPMVQKRK